MRARLFGSRKRKIASLAVIALLALGGTALAAWLVMGPASFYGKAATLSAPTFSLGTDGHGTNGDAAWPGGPNGTLHARVDNPNPVAMYPSSVDFTGLSFTVQDPSACAASNWSLNEAAIRAALHTSSLAPSANSVQYAFANALVIAVNSPNSCQGQEVDVHGVIVHWSTDVADLIP